MSRICPTFLDSEARVAVELIFRQEPDEEEEEDDEEDDDIKRDDDEEEGDDGYSE